MVKQNPHFYIYTCYNIPLMKKLLLLSFVLAQLTAFSQIKSYTSTSGEMIFSFANIKDKGQKESSNLRWSPVFNIQSLRNHNFGQYFGLFYGIGIRNVGFIYETPNSDTMHKYRTYNVGIPVGIKLGKMDGFFIYGGYEFETPFHYKEKLFISDKKEEVSGYWFNHKFVQGVNHALFAGINFKRGFNIKFKYYLNNFFNKDATRTVAGVQVKPFQNLDVNVFYIALDWNMFKDVKERRKGRGSKPADSNQYSYRF